MKLYILLDENPCFDCSNPEIIGIYAALTDAIIARDEYIAHPWTVNDKQIDVYVMEVGQKFSEARALEIYDEREP